MSDMHEVVDTSLPKGVAEGPLNSNLDDAAEFTASDGEIFEYSAKEANIVRWKLDLILLPMVREPFLARSRKRRDADLSCVDDNYVSAFFHG